MKDQENSHYYKDVRHFDFIDFYRICDLYKITDSCVQHALKKLLCLGIRSVGKTFEQDIKDARDSLNRRLQMIAEDENVK